MSEAQFPPSSKNPHLPHPSVLKKKHSLALAEAFKRLANASLSKTKGREALLRALIERHGPFSVEELHTIVQREKLDLATVYRCLTAFEKIHLVRRCDFGDGIARFELQLDTHSHHHHIICRTCRKAENIENCQMTSLERKVRSRGYTNVSHHLEFFGLCQSCQAQLKEASPK